MDPSDKSSAQKMNDGTVVIQHNLVENPLYIGIFMTIILFNAKFSPSYAEIPSFIS